MLKCFLLLVAVTSVHARGFRWYCSLSGGAIYEVVKDKSTGELYFANGTRSDSEQGGGGARRRLSAPSDTDKFLEPAELVLDSSASTYGQQDALQIKRRTAEEILNQTDMSEIIQMRECRCAGAREQYCPARLTACGIPSASRTNQTPGCVNVSKRRTFVRTVFLAVVIAYGLIALCLLTSWGRNVIGFFADSFICGWNRFFANRMMRRNPERANDWIRNHLRLRRRLLRRRYRAMIGPEALIQEQAARAAAVLAEERAARAVNAPKPTSLALKTRIHRIIIADHESEIEAAKSVDGDDEMHDETCTICFGDLKDGDRVGDLLCGHTFHASCLKSWLSRRNVCPLCQLPNAATPRFAPDAGAPNFGNATAMNIEPAVPAEQWS